MRVVVCCTATQCGLRRARAESFQTQKTCAPDPEIAEQGAETLSQIANLLERDHFARGLRDLIELAKFASRPRDRDNFRAPVADFLA